MSYAACEFSIDVTTTLKTEIATDTMANNFNILNGLLMYAKMSDVIKGLVAFFATSYNCCKVVQIQSIQGMKFIFVEMDKN